ncbi:MAG: DUF1573 domain-containing protein [Cytophagales bacterium]|nr:DUF1573 domain-containing protein [Armatimonadota bacterium]
MAAAFILAILVWRLPIFSQGLYAPRNTFNFGTAKASSIIRHTFTATNIHPWPVMVTGIPGGCGCTRGTLNRKTPFRLLPLQSVQIDVPLDTWGKRDPVRETIKLTTQNEADDLLLILHVNPLSCPRRHKPFLARTHPATARLVKPNVWHTEVVFALSIATLTAVHTGYG